jgi:hypothetical protein
MEISQGSSGGDLYFLGVCAMMSLIAYVLIRIFFSKERPHEINTLTAGLGLDGV